MGRCLRKVIRVCAEDSPNVKLALEEIRLGLPVSRRMIVPGVLSWDQYCERRQTWDKIRQCIGLDGLFYEGAGLLMFPPDWLNRAAAKAVELEQEAERLARQGKWNPRKARAIGIDPAEGGDKTSMAAVDEYGLIELVSKKTPDTSIITDEAFEFMRKHGVPPEKVCFDRGGGGRQHADRMRREGYAVMTVAFGELLLMDLKRAKRLYGERVENREEKSTYKDRRAKMYHDLRLLLDPSLNPTGFAIPAEYTNLRSELAPIPLTYDDEGRLELLPKNKRDPNQKKKTLVELIGHSPDDADSLVIAIHAMLHKTARTTAGAV